jgi:hypothetical protein
MFVPDVTLGLAMTRPLLDSPVRRTVTGRIAVAVIVGIIVGAHRP